MYRDVFAWVEIYFKPYSDEHVLSISFTYQVISIAPDFFLTLCVSYFVYLEIFFSYLRGFNE